MAILTGSFFIELLGLVTAVIAVSVAYLKWVHQYWRRRGVPYLEPTIPFGNFENPFNRTVSFVDKFLQIYREAKAKGWRHCGLYMVSTPMYLVIDLDLLKRVMTKDFQHFVDRGIYTNEKHNPIGCHLFALGGKKWRSLRTKLSPTFTSGKLKAMFQTVIDCGLILQQCIEEHIDNNEAVDIKYVLGCFTTDVIGSCAFGIECNSFKEPNSPFKVYARKLMTTTRLQSLRNLFSSNFPALARAVGVPSISKEVSDFYTKVVVDTVSYREKNNHTRKDFLQLLIDLKNKKVEGNAETDDERPLTMNEIVAQSFVFFIAGFETSSTTMTFALFELASHPEYQDKVRHEINTVLEKHNNQITYDSLSEMKYMRQVIDETLRLYPPVGFLTRQCTEDYKIPGEDIIIEKGTRIGIPIKGIHHDEEYYDDPEVFDPERFNEENKKKRHPYAHIPFGEGPRICIGERFGIMQTKVGLACLLKKFRIKLDKKTKVPLTMSRTNSIPTAEGGIWLNFEEIKSK